SNALLLLGATILVVTLFHNMKLPPIVAFITAGIAIGPFGFRMVDSSLNVGTITEVTAALLMFTIGLEFSFKELQKFKRSILILGLGQILFTITFFTILFWAVFSMSIEKSLFISLLIAPSSTAVILKLLYDSREFDSPYGKASFSILFFQDLAIIPMILVVPYLVSYSSITDSLLSSVFPFLLLSFIMIAIFYFMNRYILPFALHKISQTQNREVFFFSLLFICLGSAALMNKIGLSYSLGAFVSGMLLSGSHFGKQAAAEILPLRNAFLSLFFVSIGMMLDISFIQNHFHQILSLGLLILVVKAFLLYMIVWFSGHTSTIARYVTLLLFQFSEFSFILAELGLQNKLISEYDRQFFLAIAISSIALTPIFYSRRAWFIKPHHWSYPHKASLLKFLNWTRKSFLNLLSEPLSDDALPASKALENHIIVVGYGVAGMTLCRILKNHKIAVQVIEMNPETVKNNSDKIPILFGDAANSNLLIKAGLETAKLVVVVTTGIHMLKPIIQSIRRINKDINVLARTNYLIDLKEF
ncbi:MAG: cation:proton antiporter family protein, partial [Bdellovibrionales bacterium]